MENETTERTPNERLFRKVRKLLKRGSEFTALRRLGDRCVEGVQCFNESGAEDRYPVDHFVHNGTKYTFLRQFYDDAPNEHTDATAVASCFAHDFSTAQRVFKKYVKAERAASDERVEVAPSPAEENNDSIFREALELLKGMKPTTAARDLGYKGIPVPSEEGNTFLNSDGGPSRNNVETFVINGTPYRWTRRVGSVANWVEDSVVVAACFDHDFDVASRVFAEYVTAERIKPVDLSPLVEKERRGESLTLDEIRTVIENTPSVSPPSAFMNEDLALTKLVEERDLLRRMVAHLLDAQAAK